MITSTNRNIVDYFIILLEQLRFLSWRYRIKLRGEYVKTTFIRNIFLNVLWIIFVHVNIIVKIFRNRLFTFIVLKITWISSWMYFLFSVGVNHDNCVLITIFQMRYIALNIFYRVLQFMNSYLDSCIIVINLDLNQCLSTNIIN